MLVALLKFFDRSARWRPKSLRRLGPSRIPLRDFTPTLGRHERAAKPSAALSLSVPLAPTLAGIGVWLGSRVDIGPAPHVRGVLLANLPVIIGPITTPISVAAVGAKVMPGLSAGVLRVEAIALGSISPSFQIRFAVAN